MFEMLSKLQQTMASSIKSVGNIEHEVYPSTHSLLLGIFAGPFVFLLPVPFRNSHGMLFRFRSFATEHKTKAFAGFIDGDLVEKFLDLPRSQMEEITKGIKVW